VPPATRSLAQWIRLLVLSTHDIAEYLDYGVEDQAGIQALGHQQQQSYFRNARAIASATPNKTNTKEPSPIIRGSFSKFGRTLESTLNTKKKTIPPRTPANNGRKYLLIKFLSLVPALTRARRALAEDIMPFHIHALPPLLGRGSLLNTEQRPGSGQDAHCTAGRMRAFPGLF
jgi:hypothetical protein